jgi:hypothetical protein
MSIDRRPKESSPKRRPISRRGQPTFDLVQVAVPGRYQVMLEWVATRDDFDATGDAKSGGAE